MKSLQVAVGVIRNASEQVLISLRNPSLHQGGLWEFPGGKIESVESADQALRRELKEELDLTVLTATPLITINHQYPDRAVTLHVFLVEHFQGTAKHADGQPILWARIAELSRYRFPAANQPIITAIRLPPYYAILDDEIESQLLPNLKKILARGIKLIQARLKSLPASRVEKFIAEAYPLCKRQNALLLINSTAVFAAQSDSDTTWFHRAARKAVAADGIHLTSRHLLSLDKRPEYYPWIAASCHNLQELHHAQKLGIDFVVLAPVLPTKTHHGAQPLGWEQFSNLIAEINIPVYALGGMTWKSLEIAQLAGGQGIAGIRAFLD